MTYCRLPFLTLVIESSPLMLCVSIFYVQRDFASMSISARNAQNVFQVLCVDIYIQDGDY